MSTPTPAATSAPAPLWLRLLRSVVAIALALALTVIAIIAVCGYLPLMRDSFEQASSVGSKVLNTVAVLAVIFVIFLPLGLVVVVARKRWLTWKVLAVGWLAVLPVLGWLAWDEPAVRQPLTIEEFSPPFPGAEQSYAVLMQYSKQTPSDEAKAFAATKLNISAIAANPRESAKWIDLVSAKRADLEMDWATLAPQRRWFAELAAFDRIGDLTPSDYNANMMAFQVWRTLSYHICAEATLRALDGKGDEAIALLVPQIEVSRKLQLSSRTLVRTMVAVVVERMGLETAGLVLDHATVSAGSRARLATALANENAPALARRLLLVEYVQFAPLTMRMKLGDNIAIARGSPNFILRRPLNFLSSLFFNPIATTNVYGDRVRELADLAEARDLGKFSVRSQDFGNYLGRQTGMKNVGGRLMISMAVPSYEKVVATHWQAADLRDGLRKRLAELPNAPAPAAK